MAQRTLTEPERIKELQTFGYTPNEAQFLLLPALHGGYFLRRHYSRFLGREDGGTITQLVQKALDLGHAKASTWRQNTQLYHLCARPFYEAIGQGDNRNRRMRELNTIKAKIMGLDFVLTHHATRFLATDQEKVDFFTGVLGVAATDLPSIQYKARGAAGATTRYFTEKFPIYVTEMSAHPSVVSFCFVDEGLAGLAAFESFLKRYHRLFEALNTFEVVYVAAGAVHFEKALARFQHLLQGGVQDWLFPPISPEELPRVLDYFVMRQAYESGDFAAFDRDRFIRLRNARERFSGREFEALFRAWEGGGNQALQHILAQKQQEPRTMQGRFSTCLLANDYSAFATVAAA